MVESTRIFMYSGNGWANFYKLNRRLIHRIPIEQPLVDLNGILIYDPADKAEIFATTMASQFQTPDMIYHTDE